MLGPTPEERPGLVHRFEPEITSNNANGLHGFCIWRITRKKNIVVGQVGLAKPIVEVADLLRRRLCALDSAVARMVAWTNRR